MFSSDKNIESIRRLCAELKSFVLLRMRLARLDFVDKMTVLLSALVLGAILFMLITIVVLFLSYTAALALAEVVGSTAAFALITSVYALLALIVYALRKKLIIDPMANFLGNLFLNENEEEKEEGHGN